MTPCYRLKMARLRMQQYKITADRFPPGAYEDRYANQREIAEERSRVLAKQMVHHAKTCRLCVKNNEIEYEDFYGLGKYA